MKCVYPVNNEGKYKACGQEGANYLCCDIVDTLVCHKHSCLCYRNKPPLTDEQVRHYEEKMAAEE